MFSMRAVSWPSPKRVARRPHPASPLANHPARRAVSIANHCAKTPRFPCRPAIRALMLAHLPLLLIVAPRPNAHR
jgi:hypothetical protein